MIFIGALTAGSGTGVPVPPEMSDRTHVPSGVPDGAAALEELAADSALHVWRTLRLLLAFAAGGPAADWYAPDVLQRWEEDVLRSTLDLSLRAPLAVVIGELCQPARTDVTAVSWACWCLVEWATPDHTATALAFSEAAALVSPSSGRYAMLHARMLRRRGASGEAELWYRRACRLARTHDDVETVVLGTSGLGMLLWERGDADAASEHLVRAQRMARRAGLRTLESEVLHNRFAVAITVGRFRQAEAFARSTFEGYLPDHPRLPALAYDLAYLWLSQGYAGHALPLLRVLLPRFHEPPPRFQVLAAIARAAGMLGERRIFLASASEAKHLSSDVESQAVFAPALIDIGFGALSLEAERIARRALCVARDAAERRAQADMVLRAEEGIARLTTRAKEMALIGPNDPQRRSFSDRVMRAIAELPSSCLD